MKEYSVELQGESSPDSPCSALDTVLYGVATGSGEHVLLEELPANLLVDRALQQPGALSPLEQKVL